MARAPRIARLQAASVSFTAAFDGAVEEQQAQFAAFARAENAKIMADEPRPGSFRRWVDGHEGAVEETVRPDGVIRYAYERLQMVVDFALATLRELSPVLEGDYRAGHIVFVNGTAVESLAESLGGRREGSEIVIANGVPYSRKIEFGKMKMRVPGTDHVYSQAELIVKRRMGNLARVSFSFRTVRMPGSAVGKIFHSRKGVRVRTGGRTRSVADAQRFPALVITERR
jgi:hypothetical protein